MVSRSTALSAREFLLSPVGALWMIEDAALT
jgi:hypothetical protein